MLGVVAFSALVGIWRGFVFELLSLAGWFVAYFAARWLQPWAGAASCRSASPGSLLNHGAAFACAFIVVLIVWSFVARGIAALIKRRRSARSTACSGPAFGVLRAAARAAGVRRPGRLHAGGAVAGLARSAGAAMAGSGAAGAAAVCLPEGTVPAQGPRRVRD